VKAPRASCGFCGRDKDAVKILIVNAIGMDAAICDQCVERAVEEVDRQREQRRTRKAEATRERSGA
jgi:ATP-dependent protease Clp ATPase subunit